MIPLVAVAHCAAAFVADINAVAVPRAAASASFSLTASLAVRTVAVTRIRAASRKVAFIACKASGAVEAASGSPSKGGNCPNNGHGRRDGGTRGRRFFVLRHGQTDANALGLIQGSADFSRLTDLGREQAAAVAARGGGLFDAGDRENQQRQRPVVVRSVYVSPLARARETLSVVLQESTVVAAATEQQRGAFFGSKPVVDTGAVQFPSSEDVMVLDELREIDFYDWEGRHKDELRAEFPASWNAWKVGDPVNLVVPDTSKRNGGGSGDCTARQRRPLLELWARADQIWDIVHSREMEIELAEGTGQDRWDPAPSPSPVSLIVAHGSLGQALVGTAMGWDATFFRQHPFPNCGLAEIVWDADLDVDFTVCNPQSNGNVNDRASRWRWRWPVPSKWMRRDDTVTD